MFRLTFQTLLSLFLFSFISLQSKADVFVVNSNADSGIGTLREALIKAANNGTAVKDEIHFNLTDQTEAGRTIILLSQLPNVSSNLEIDGSSQNGNFFGRSTSKIKLIANFTYQNSYFGLTLHNVSDVNIYGLYIQNIATINYSTGVFLELMQGISLKSAKNIKIGDVGKGNVISGFHRDLASNIRIGNNEDTYVENITLKANFIGLEADGITIPPRNNALQSESAYMQNLYGVVDIGDGTEAGQNVFAKGISMHQMNTGQYPEPLYSTPAFLNFRYNIFGNNLDINATDGIATKGISILSSAPYTLSTVNIKDNVIVGVSAIQLSGIKNPVDIKRNYIGVDRDFKKIEGISTGIFIYYLDKVQIGGDNPSDANFIGYCKPINVWPYTSASINKNSFFCAKNAYPMIFDGYGTRPFPKVEVTSITANSVSGTANPNSQIELFYSDLCGTCSPETYFGNTVADANGKWEYNGTILRSVIASATLNGITSEFTRTRIDISSIRITNTCTNTGSIKGALPLSATYVEWLNVNDEVVEKGRDLLDKPIGLYRLRAVNGDCSDVSPWFEIKKALIVNTDNTKILNATCGVGGSISGLQVVNNTSSATIYSWKNELGVELATTQNLSNAVPGKYTLTIRTADNSCTETYGPITLVTASGPEINLSSIVITPASCSGNSGGITGIVVNGTGTLSYRWTNATNIQVGTSKDLISQPPGTYILEVTDQSSCGVVRTTPITILDENAITISDSEKQIFNPTCSKNNGSVKGLRITGATSYLWKNDKGEEVSSQLNLEGMAPGNYQFTASNSSCTKTYDVVLIVQPNLIKHNGITKILSDATCGINNGKITVVLQNATRLPKTYRWVDQSGKTLGGRSATIENLDAGTYSVYGIDDNDCEIFLATYTIGRVSFIDLDSDNFRITNDECNQNLGSITGLKVSGGLAPYTFTWINEAGLVVGNTLDINNLPKDKYVLEVRDALNCVPLFSEFRISNEDKPVSSPVITPIQLCAPGIANIIAKGSVNATSYALYLSKESLIPIDIVSNGVFKVDIKNSNSYFITQRVGNCESEKVELKATVGLSGLTIANAITPNNDSVNDTWILKGIENYPKAHIQIFSRTGSKVYNSIGYKTPFTGTNNGQTLPIGVYYYVIKLGTDCEIINGSLTLIR